MQEVQGTINSLNNAGKAIMAKLGHHAKTGDLSKVQVKALESAQEQISDLSSKYQAILEQADKVKNTLSN